MIPSGLDAGEYQLELDLGPGSPSDLNLKNNTSLGIQHFENGQDMTASISSVPFSIPTPTSFSVPVVFKNLGLQPATAIPWTLDAHRDGRHGLSDRLGLHQPRGPDLRCRITPAVISQTLPSGAYTLSLVLGTTSQAGTSPATPDLNTANNFVLDQTPIFVYSTTADYAVGPGDLVLDGATHAAAGQVVGVTRTIHNLEGPAGPCPYSYFLNPPGVSQIGNGVPVAILTNAGATFAGMTSSFAAFGQAGAQNTSTDQIMIPVGMQAGSYNLVLAVDPGNTVADTNPGNNDVALGVQLAANLLTITSPSALPAAIVGTPYLYGLTESGGGTQVSWSLLAGSLPPGITLNSSGQLTGTPTEPGVFTIVVQLAALGDTQTAVLQLPVAAGSGALSIEKSGPQLPTGIVGTMYIQQLEAEGGVPPYSWASTINFGLTLNSMGVLSGTPLQPTDGPIQFTVNVTDSIGTRGLDHADHPDHRARRADHHDPLSECGGGRDRVRHADPRHRWNHHRGELPVEPVARDASAGRAQVPGARKPRRGGSQRRADPGRQLPGGPEPVRQLRPHCDPSVHPHRCRRADTGASADAAGCRRRRVLLGAARRQ